MARYLQGLIILLLLAGFSRESLGQVRKYSFQRITEEHGLAQNFAYGLVQDDRGFLWVGTGMGLSRYDGYEFKNFTTRDSLSADFISADFRSSSGSLVFGHNRGGVTLFDGLRFHIMLPDTLDSKVVAITEDDGNNFWVATQSKGMFFIDKDRKRISHVLPDELQGQIINVLVFRNGLLWVGTNEGLFFFRTNRYSLTAVENNILPPYVPVNALLGHGADSTLTWVGTSFSGLFLLQADDENVKVSRAFQIPELEDNIIQALAEDADGDMWVGTRQHGVFHLNIGRDRRSIFRITAFGKATGFPFTSSNKLVVDRQGQVWVATSGDGLVKIYRELFTYFPFSQRFGVTEVRSMAETDFGYLVATDQGLLQITLDRQSDEFLVDKWTKLHSKSVLSVFTDSRDDTWIGTETDGVFVISAGAHELVAVNVGGGENQVEARLFEEDNDGNIWISARGQGVYVLDRKRQLVRHFTTANQFIHNDVFAIKADSKGNVWFGTYGAGLAMLDKESDSLNLFSKREALPSRDINDIDEDAAGNIWIATEGNGFYKYNGSEFTQVGSVETLTSPYIKGIQYDPSGRIWFSYRKGLGYYDLTSAKKHHFTKQDGLLANEAYSSSIIVDSKMNKWFCNDYGVTLFEHDSIADTRKSLITYLTGIRIFFKDFPADLGHAGELDQPMVGKIPPLKLTHEENHITVDFVAIKLNRTAKIYYRHLLEGYDSEWTPPKTANFVTYTNLDAGEYVLKVQATDDLGTWVDPVTEYAFTITPPYWKRTWFYLLQILSVITLFALTYFIGKKGLATKRYVLRLMLFSSFFITLEYVENFVDPLISNFFGGAPVFRFFLNFVLALLLLPVETIITHWMMDDEGIKAKAVGNSGSNSEGVSVEALETTKPESLPE